MTKEILAGYYLLDCPDLDVALDAAAQLPMAGYGSVEVRRVMTEADVHRCQTGCGSWRSSRCGRRAGKHARRGR